MALCPELHRETMAGGQVIVENRQVQPLTSYWLAVREQILPAESRPMVCLPWGARHGGARPRHGTSPAGRRTRRRRVGSPARLPKPWRVAGEGFRSWAACSQTLWELGCLLANAFGVRRFLLSLSSPSL